MIFSQAPVIRGHELIVRKLEKADGRLTELPENYVVKDDSYFANYKSGYTEWSEIAKQSDSLVRDYIPRLGELVEA